MKPYVSDLNKNLVTEVIVFFAKLMIILYEGIRRFVAVIVPRGLFNVPVDIFQRLCEVCIHCL